MKHKEHPTLNKQSGGGGGSENFCRKSRPKHKRILKNYVDEKNAC